MNFAESASHAPYTIPLTPGGFSRALRTGHGRALQHAGAHGLSGMTDARFAFRREI